MANDQKTLNESIGGVPKQKTYSKEPIIVVIGSKSLLNMIDHLTAMGSYTKGDNREIVKNQNSLKLRKIRGSTSTDVLKHRNC